jgi:hypothetical protein
MQQRRSHRALFELARKVFMLMIDPETTPVAPNERRNFDINYHRTKMLWLKTNPLVPKSMREPDAEVRLKSRDRRRRAA